MNKLALFDFDNTITKKDTMLEFCKYCAGPLKYYYGLFLIAPIIILLKLKIIKSQQAKELMLRLFFKGCDITEIQKMAISFSQKRLPGLIYKDALNKISWHKEQGHDIFIVSASVDTWIEPWCKTMQLGLISSKFEIKKGKLTGKLVGKNCNGEEKVFQIRKDINLNNYSEIYAYGDSTGDKPMLALATYQYWKPFNV